MFICPVDGGYCQLTGCVEHCAREPESMPERAPALIGWQCPACGRGNAPWQATCPCGPHVHIIKTDHTGTP